MCAIAVLRARREVVGRESQVAETPRTMRIERFEERLFGVMWIDGSLVQHVVAALGINGTQEPTLETHT